MLVLEVPPPPHFLVPDLSALLPVAPKPVCEPKKAKEKFYITIESPLALKYTRFCHSGYCVGRDFLEMTRFRPSYAEDQIQPLKPAYHLAMHPSIWSTFMLSFYCVPARLWVAGIPW